MPTSTESVSFERSSPAIVSRTLFPGVEDVSCFFLECDDQVPIFHGESYGECVAVWQVLSRTDKRTQFRKAAVTASLERAAGQRSDLGGGETSIQQFCRAVGIGPAHFSRLARTHKVFAELLDTGLKKSLPALLADDAMTFKHFFIAANHSVLPVEALIEARDQCWSANELARRLAARKDRTLLDAATGEPVQANDDDDDLDVQWRNLPERTEPTKAVPGTRKVTLVLTAKEYSGFARQLQDLAAVLKTDSDHDTVLAVVQRLHELVAVSCAERAA